MTVTFKTNSTAGSISTWMDEDLFDDIRWFPQNHRLRKCFGRMLPISFINADAEIEFAKLQAERRHALLKPFVLLMSPLMTLVSVILIAKYVSSQVVSDLSLASVAMLQALAILLFRIKISDAVFIGLAVIISALWIWQQTCRHLAVLGNADLLATCEKEHSDTFTLLQVVAFVSFVCSMPGRSLRCIWLCMLVPGIYWASLVYMPGHFEGDASRRRSLCYTFFAVSFYFLAGRVRLEKLERMDYLRQVALSTYLTQERVLRSKAEYEAASASRSEDSASRREETRPMEDEKSSAVGTNISSLVLGRSLDNAELQMRAAQALGEQEGWAIPEDSLCLNIEAGLGNGSYGTVITGKYLDASVAVKLSMSETPQDRLADLSNDIRHLRRLSHPNIVSFYGACFVSESKDVLLVMENLSGGQVLSTLISQRSIDSDVQDKILLGVVSALAYLHPVIIHGDLKPHNVMVMGSQSKLVDFGLSRRCLPTSKPTSGTRLYMAPEVLAGRVEPAPASDIFSFGRMAFEVRTGRNPVGQATKQELSDLANRGLSPALPWLEGEAAQDFVDTCNLCTCSDPAGRPNIQDVRKLLTNEDPQILSEVMKDLRTADGSGKRSLHETQNTPVAL